MVYFEIKEPNKDVKYIKNINGAEGTIEFQASAEGAYCKDEGFWADSEYEFIMFHFKKKYPELEYMRKKSTWDR